MGIRLNKIGNIPEQTPVTASTAFAHFNSGDKAYIAYDDKVWPFAADSFVGKWFRSYDIGSLSDTGAALTYVGEGAQAFRADKGDYFAAGFNIDHLFDQDRLHTPILLGITTTMWAIVDQTMASPQLIPMIIWSADANATNHQRHVSAYSILSPTFEMTYTPGKVGCTSSVDRTVAVEQHGYKHVYLAWVMCRHNPNDISGAYNIHEVGVTLSANSLKGNRPVYDPVMV